MSVAHGHLHICVAHEFPHCVQVNTFHDDLKSEVMPHQRKFSIPASFSTAAQDFFTLFSSPPETGGREYILTKFYFDSIRAVALALCPRILTLKHYAI
jgi:hypothetical protein